MARSQEATGSGPELVRLADLPDFLTVDQVAAVLRLSRGSVYQAVRRGELPSVPLGRRLLIPKRFLMRLAGMEAESEAAERAARRRRPRRRSGGWKRRKGDCGGK
jgi:excisionase family DNA binding protein